jgi:16S rRNA (adenine1518-N6/adenine1519-N6)-dimethyltransferase
MSNHPRKRLGQHFLHDPAVIARIVREVAPQRDDCIVEIGGGRGALTMPLLEQLDTLHVVELDERWAAELEQSQAARVGRLQVHHADALEFDFSALATRPGGLRVVGNLPYNISTPLLFHLLDQRAAISDMVFMVQKEVAKRILAAPGSKDYGRLTVMLSAWMDAEACFDVGPGAFKPPPRVWSTVLHARPRTESRYVIDDERRFADLVRQAFSMRRKTLRRGLEGLLTREQIAAAGIDPSARAETLAPAQFAALARLT